MKDLVLRLIKGSGALRLASSLTRARLPILCYHAFSGSDAHLFRPALFMRPEVFRSRMQWLADRSYRVLPLAEGLERLRSGTLPARSAVITIDDGMASVRTVAAPILARHGFPATLYLTTYHVTHRSPVFRLVLQYMFWKTRKDTLDLESVGIPGGGVLHTGRGTLEPGFWELVRHGEEERDEPGRIALMAAIGRELAVDYEALCRSEEFTLLAPDHVKDLAAGGLDIQLHTHRHRFPAAEDVCVREIEDNRGVIKELTGRDPIHFCYPSGDWLEPHPAILERLGVASATTCDHGLNRADTPPFRLLRLLDHDQSSMISFESQLRGLHDLVRRGRPPHPGID